MTEWITARQFHETDGVEDWRVGGEGACAYFRTGSFAAGAGLVPAKSQLTGPDDHHPDFQVTIDALVDPEVMPFWRALLDYADRGDSPEDLIDPGGRGPSFWFQEMDARLQPDRAPWSSARTLWCAAMWNNPSNISMALDVWRESEHGGPIGR